MKVIHDILAFEWDNGNLQKSYAKHSVSTKEAEEIFVSDKLFAIPDVQHSGKEKRYIALGQTLNKKNLFVVFTIRSNKIRIISARRMHQKEVKRYEKAQKDTNI